MTFSQVQIGTDTDGESVGDESGYSIGAIHNSGNGSDSGM